MSLVFDLFSVFQNFLRMGYNTLYFLLRIYLNKPNSFSILTN